MAVDIGSLIPSLVGLGTKLGTSIPGLRKPKKVDTASQVARLAPSVAGSAVGAAQSGQGASRGLALREGLRQASAAAGEVAGQVGIAAARDAQLNQANLDARNARLASFGADAAAGLAQAGASLIQPKPETTPQQQQAQQTIQEQPELQGVKNITGLDGPGASIVPQQQALTEAMPEIEGLEPQDTLDTLEQTAADEAAGPTARFASRAALDELYTSSPTVAAPDIEADLENRLQAKKLMLQDAERMGLDLGTVLATINRRLGLKPGQSVANPMGVAFDPGAE